MMSWLSDLLFNHPATTEIYPLSLHDALPILTGLPDSDDARRALPPSTDDARRDAGMRTRREVLGDAWVDRAVANTTPRSEEHTSELQSLAYLVCRLLLEKKKNNHSNLPKYDI